jgi:hypothetical protein
MAWFASEPAIELALFFTPILGGCAGPEPGGRDDGERHAAQARAAVAGGRPLDGIDLARLSPPIHAHINLNGRYHIHPDEPPRHLSPGRDTLATYR